MKNRWIALIVSSVLMVAYAAYVGVPLKSESAIRERFQKEFFVGMPSSEALEKLDELHIEHSPVLVEEGRSFIRAIVRNVRRSAICHYMVGAEFDLENERIKRIEVRRLSRCL